MNMVHQRRLAMPIRAGWIRKTQFGPDALQDTATPDLCPETSQHSERQDQLTGRNRATINPRHRRRRNPIQHPIPAAVVVRVE